jgi:hypothetical protein
MTEICHHTTSTVSDHDPVSVKILLTNNSGRAFNKPRRTYFKANSAILKKQSNMAALKQAWQNPIKSEQPHVRFHVDKSRFRSKYIELQKEHFKISSLMSALQQELDGLKNSIQHNPLLQEVQVLKATRTLLRDLEYTDALNRLKTSRKKSIALGDSSTKYFFNIFKNKAAHASMTKLIQPNGEIIQDEIKIISEVHAFYTKLYSTDPGFKYTQPNAMNSIFAHMSTFLTIEQVQMVEKVPDIEEVHQTLKDLANNKAPGIDGIIAEVLKDCWDFIGQDFFALIIQF